MVFTDPPWALLTGKHPPGSCCLQKHLQPKQPWDRDMPWGAGTPSSPVSDASTAPQCRGQPPAQAPTICPTQMLAASIMAPSAMERADSFSRWGFPDSSSSTTCKAQGELQAGDSGGMGQRGAHVTFLYSCSVIFPSWSESYMWNRTGRDRGRGQGQGSPSLPTSPNPARDSLTFQFLLAEAVELLLVHVHLDGSEVGHDGQEVLEVDLLRQPVRLLPQVPGGARARGEGEPQTPLPSPSHPQHGFRAALSLRFSINVSFSTWSHPRLEGEDPCPAPSHFQRINLPSLPAGGFSPLVKEGVDDFPPDWVELQVGNAVKVLLAAEGTETAPSVREMERRENPESH